MFEDQEKVSFLLNSSFTNQKLKMDTLKAEVWKLATKKKAACWLMES